MKYSIDTSSILEGWRRHYPPDVFPGLWDQLDALIADGHLRSTEEVLHELERKDDELFEWAKARPAFFVDIDDVIQRSVQKLLAKYKKLLDTRKNRSGADPFVIALAGVNSCSVVSNELRTGSLNRPNIPDVCADMGIRCITLLELIREQEWQFS